MVRKTQTKAPRFIVRGYDAQSVLQKQAFRGLVQAKKFAETLYRSEIFDDELRITVYPEHKTPKE